ncbi:MAG: metalloregulator ArsR/SmtB family transcription factor [Cytophagaceae bacterium]|jgi:ArsR family transcriptional regulator|nr:metalloregulator ArsR/SmtB family transcription factor [Cytophagaceae bacterium]
MQMKGLDYHIHFFQCLGESSRLRILYLIYKAEEMCISDLELILDFTQTKTSRHLNYMKRLGMLEARKFDQWVYYKIEKEYLRLFEMYCKELDQVEDLRKDLFEYRTLYTNNELAIRKLHAKQKKYKLPAL